MNLEDINQRINVQSDLKFVMEEGSTATRQAAMALMEFTSAGQSAANRIDFIKFQLANLPINATGDQVLALNKKLSDAEQKFLYLIDSGQGIKKIVPPTEEAANAMGQLETMATRVIERMVIIQAVRGAFRWITEIIEAANALVQLNKELDISVTTLAALQVGAKDLDMPFTKITTAIDTLNKNFSTMKSTSLNALIELKLNVATLLEMRSDERLHDVARAFDEIKDPVDRARLSMALYGTDTVPMLTANLKKVEDQARETGRALDEVSTRQLAQLKGGWTDFTDIISVSSAKSLASWVPFAEALIEKGNQIKVIVGPSILKAAAALDELFLKMLPGAQFAHTFMDIAKSMTTLDLEAGKTKQDLVGVITAQVNVQQELSKIFNEQLPIEKELTEEQRKALQVLTQFGILTEENALRLNIATDQWKKYVKEVAEGQALIAQWYNLNATATQKLAQEFANYSKNGIDAARSMIGELEALEAQIKITAQAAFISTNDAVAQGRIKEDLAKRLITLSELQKKAQDELNAAMYKEAQAAAAIEAAELARFGVMRVAGGNIGLDQITDVSKKQDAIDYAQAQLAAAEANRQYAQAQLDAATKDEERARAQTKLLQAEEDIRIKSILLRGAMNDYAVALLEVEKANDKSNAALTQSQDKMRGVTTTADAARDSIQGLAGSYRMLMSTVDASNNKGMFLGGSQTPRQFDTGGPVTQTGPAIVHEGEYIIPRGGSAPSGMGGGTGDIQVFVSIAGSSVAGVIDRVIIDKAKQSRKLPSSS